MFILKEIASLQTQYDKLIKNGLTKQDLCDLVIPFRDKYGLSDRDALLIVRNQISLSEIVSVMEAHMPKVAMVAEEKAANAFSAWCHEKATSFERQEEDSDSESRKWICHGRAQGYRDAACMFDALTTRNVHLPPEIKPYLN